MKTQLCIAMPASYAGKHHLHFLGIGLLLITACSLFKEKSFYQADSLLRQNTNREMKTSLNAHSKMTRIYISSDSADKHNEAEIFPVGFFSYSVTDGFKGKAERIVIKGRIKEGKLVRDSGQLTLESNVSSEIKEAERVVQKTRSKKKEVETRNYALLYLAGGLLIFAGVYFFRRFRC